MNISHNLIEFIESFSYSQRRKRKFESYKQECIQLNNMDDEELEFEYITTKIRYEHDKNVFMLIVLTLLLSILSNVWSKFFEFASKAMEYAASLVDNRIESAKVILLITMIIVLFLSFIILFCLHTRLDELKKQRSHMIIVEEVRKKRNVGVTNEGVSRFCKIET